MALVASVGIHWLLQQGLARTALDIRPLEGLLPVKSSPPKEMKAADFPLRIDPSQRASFAHEQPLEMPLAIDAAAPAGIRGTGREAERAVTPEVPGELPETPDVMAESIDRPVVAVGPALPTTVAAPERAAAIVPEGVAVAEATEMTVGSDEELAWALARRDPVAGAKRALDRESEAVGPTADELPDDVVPLTGLTPRRFSRPTASSSEIRGSLPLGRAEFNARDDGEAPTAAGSTIGAPMAAVDAVPADDPPPGPMGDDVTPRPAARSPHRGGARIARATGALQRNQAGVGSEGDGGEGLSVATAAELSPLANTLRPRGAPGAVPATATNTPATPLPRAATLVLPAETRVRETAEAFARRSRTNRGVSDTDRIVEKGLEWLARSQQSDGRWTLGKYHPAGVDGAVRLQSDTAATGLALLSFLGAGYDHFDGRYAETVRRGLEWMVSVQKADGDLYLQADPVSNSCARMYSHGIATTALCEAVGMTGDPRLRPAAEKAIGFIVASQQRGRGGWRYQPRADSDLSVTGWMLVALRAGTLAGLSVPPDTFAAVESFLERSAIPEKAGHFLYNAGNPGQRPSELSVACMTALGSLMSLHTGTPRADPAIGAACVALGAMKPSYGSTEVRARDAYLWYYSSQVLVQSGNAEWEEWYRQLSTLLGSTQVAAGSDAGSWDPLGPIPDRWGAYGGRLYVTALHLLALEVPYRHLPTYGVTDEAGP